MREIFKCTEQCYSQARENVGTRMSVEDVMQEILRDRSYYKRTGGGVVVSGGEPLAQSEFLLSLLKKCKEENIHTAIETSGHASWEDLSEATESLDFVFYDLKVIDSTKHKIFTGHSNETILANAVKMSVRASEKHIPVVIRIPIVPEYTDSEENLRGITRFVAKELKNIKGIELIPYRRLGVHKYKRIGLSCSLEYLKPPTKERMKKLEEVVRSEKIPVVHM